MNAEEIKAIRAENEAGKAAIEWCAYGHDESERKARALVDTLLAEVERLAVLWDGLPTGAVTIQRRPNGIVIISTGEQPEPWQPDIGVTVPHP